MSEWSVDGMNVIVLHGLRAKVENGTVLSCYEAFIYTHTIGVCERDQRERRERERRQE